MIQSVLGKLVTKTKYFVALLLTAIIIADKVWNLGLGVEQSDMTPITQILSIWGVVIGVDGLEGAAANLKKPAPTPAPPAAPPTTGSTGSGVTTPP